MAIQKIGADQFEAVINSGDKVLVDFFATWCGPCKFIAPILEEMAEQLEEGQQIIKVDIDENNQLAMDYQVTAVPTLVMFRDGKETGRLVGVGDPDAIGDLFE